jgi:hypothetical protein
VPGVCQLLRGKRVEIEIAPQQWKHTEPYVADDGAAGISDDLLQLE